MRIMGIIPLEIRIKYLLYLGGFSEAFGKLRNVLASAGYGYATLTKEECHYLSTATEVKEMNGGQGKYLYFIIEPGVERVFYKRSNHEK